MQIEKTILSTKELPENLLSNTIEGITLECIPFIKTIPLSEQAIADKIMAANKGIQQAIFTSANAIEAVKNLPFFTSIHQFYTLSGNATQQMLNEFAHQNASIVTAPNAAQLAERIIEQKLNQPIYFFCGNIRLDVLPKTLMAAGVHLMEIPVYHTHLTPQFISKQYDGILFFSPSAVESFFSVNSVPSHTVVCAIGDTTAASLKKNCNNMVIISSSPNANILLQQASKFLNNKSISKQ